MMGLMMDFFRINGTCLLQCGLGRFAWEVLLADFHEGLDDDGGASWHGTDRKSAPWWSFDLLSSCIARGYQLEWSKPIPQPHHSSHRVLLLVGHVL